MEDRPQALQIIATDDAGHEGKFILREENLVSIISKIPPDMKVAVVSVVGAFRTGKSFLLNLFLRYLRQGKKEDLGQGWMVAEGEEVSEGNMNEGWSLVDSTDTSKSTDTSQSFGWRGGKDRQTTGIWMWSEPILRATNASHGEDLAILLMDTQGMFDNETTMTLTAQIFGLSTLISSFQIYNVDKRIQEDNLQHLALFSEYGRMSLLPKNEQIRKLEVGLMERSRSLQGASIIQEKDYKEETEAESASLEQSQGSQADEVEEETKPFQRLQFLVRDWQNFDDPELSEDNPAQAFEQITGMRSDMQSYLFEVLRSRNLSDLQSTREQIVRCFESLDCFMLPHPGFAVTKKNYDGNIQKIDPFFRSMVNYYVRYVFDEELGGKSIHKVFVTGQELMTYIKIYVEMFTTQGEESGFPKAMTVLDATAEGNNRIAFDRGLQAYKGKMTRYAGPESAYLAEQKLFEHHEDGRAEAVKIFDDIATMGMPSNIQRFREQLGQNIEEEWGRYKQTNALRNPYKDVEYYILPLGIAIAAWLFSVLVDVSCSHDVCERIEDTFVNVYLFIFFAFIFMTWKHIRGSLVYAKEFLLPMLLSNMEKQKTH